MHKKKLSLITMGCSKNLVDSEHVKHMFEEAGYLVEHNPESIDADEVVINTCGFIGDAKEESIEMILQCAQAKKNGLVRHISVMGCLSERYRDELAAEIPEVDHWFGKFDWNGIVKVLSPGDEKPDKPWKRSLTTPPHSAYVKISEGCNRFCAFCAIPLITGRHKSRPIEEILIRLHTSTVQVTFPTLGCLLGIDGHHAHLRTKMLGNLVDEARILDGRGVDGYLVGTGTQQSVHILQFVDATTYGEGDADVRGYPFHQVGEGLASFVACGDVEINQFIGTLLAIGTSQFYWVTRLAKVDKVRSLYGLSVLDVKAGYDSFC